MKNFEERMESIRNKSNTRKKARQRKTAIALSCAGVFVLALILSLFVPYSTALPSIRKYANSPYYAVIEKLNAYTYKGPAYKNRFEALMGRLNALGSSAFQKNEWVYAPGDNMIPETDASVNNSGSYVEVTDNQVEGVIEGDVFKRSDKYIYHLYGATLNIYSIAGEDSGFVCGYQLSSFLPEELSCGQNIEMYLSQDCCTLTLVFPDCYCKSTSNCVILLELDVSDPTAVKESGRVMFEGRYLSSRMVDGELLLFYSYSFSSDPDFDDPASFVPRYGWMEEMHCIDGEDIIVPDVMTGTYYTVVCRLEGKGLALKDCKALLSYGSESYVSRENIFFASSYWTVVEENANEITTRQVTKITGIRYAGDALETIGSIQLEGSIKDQYSMDEHDGILRVVTSTANDRKEKNYSLYDAKPDIWWDFGQMSVNLYCIDLSTWTVAGMAEGFAPKGEEATAVRFEGSTAYVCTAEIWTATDPVFFFDLSDPTNITWTDTGIIDGYSTSLVNFGEGTLLGIGYDENRSLKVELYRKENGKVVGFLDYTLECYFSENYKDYYIDRENGYIGLAVYAYKTDEFQYLLLHFDGERLVVEKQLPIKANGVVDIRADVIEDWLYILASDLTVVKP